MLYNSCNVLLVVNWTEEFIGILDNRLAKVLVALNRQRTPFVVVRVAIDGAAEVQMRVAHHGTLSVVTVYVLALLLQEVHNALLMEYGGSGIASIAIEAMSIHVVTLDDAFAECRILDEGFADLFCFILWKYPFVVPFGKELPHPPHIIQKYRLQHWLLFVWRSHFFLEVLSDSLKIYLTSPNCTFSPGA